jgi:hypothetical protein
MDGMSVSCCAHPPLSPAIVPNRSARGERRDRGRVRSSMTHSAAFIAATTRRSSANGRDEQA